MFDKQWHFDDFYDSQNKIHVIEITNYYEDVIHLCLQLPPSITVELRMYRIALYIWLVYITY
jgi:hypothetical protein